MSASCRRLVIIIFVLLFGTAIKMTTIQVQAANESINTDLVDFVPSWVKKGGKSEMLKRMVDPKLRGVIEEEITENVNKRVQNVSDMEFPQLNDTLGDWMTKFNLESGFDYDISPGIALWSHVNLDHDNGNKILIDDFLVYDLDKDEPAFHYDFTGEDGSDWDPEAFGSDLFGTAGKVDYSIENNSGKVVIGTRAQGSSSSYGKVTPKMTNVNNSEVVMRFKVDEVNKGTQWFRLWIQSDKFSSGSSFANNGYGIGLNLKNGELRLQKRTNGITTTLDTVQTNFSTDWHKIKLSASNGKIGVSLWNDSKEEPEDWDIEYDSDQISKKAMLSFLNLDTDNDNTFAIDELMVTSGEDTIYDYTFQGNNGEEWDTDAFEQMHQFPTDKNVVSFDIQDNEGRVKLGKRTEDLSVPSGKVVTNMENVKESDFLTKFRMDHIGTNQKMKAFIRADKFYDGNTAVVNGFGAEIDIKSNELSLFKMENKVNYHYGSIKANITNDWHWLRLQVKDEEVGVKLWKDGENEPENWLIAGDTKDNISSGETIMRLIMLRGNLNTVYTSTGDEPKPEVDKSELEERVVEIENRNLNENDYTVDSWSIFEAALDNANEVLLDENATQKEVDERLRELNAAIDRLEEVGGSGNKELQKKVDEIENANLQESDYTKESWQALQEALDNANEVLADENALNEDITKALNQLDEAYEGLKATVDKNPLKEKLNIINDENLNKDDYTNQSWEAFDTAKRIAEQLVKLENSQLNQRIIDKSLSNLNVAYEELEEK